jgi:hypothetical protein
MFISSSPYSFSFCMNLNVGRLEQLNKRNET